MPRFDVGEQNRQCSETWKGVGRTFLVLGLILAAFQTSLIVGPLILLHHRDLLTTNFGITLWGPGAFAAFCLWTFAIRTGPGPSEVAITPDEISLNWASGRTRRIHWGDHNPHLNLLDASQTESGRQLMKPDGWYMLLVPWSPLAFALSREAFDEIIRVARQRGLDITRVPSNPQFSMFFGEKVLIRRPRMAAASQ
jgi:hypothetical protein